MHAATLSCLVLLLGPRFVLTQGLQWPYNLPPHAKYYPEDELLVRRNIEISQRVAEQQPMFVRKMSGDPNEKFLLDFWCFAEDDGQNINWANQTLVEKFGHPLPLHSDLLAGDARPLVSWLPRHALKQRDFGCPTDTTSCTSIDRPNTCCPNGSTCQIVPDNGLGDVGCCAAAQTCAGSLSQCPEGYASCPNNPGGGCCLPGYACFAEGCVMTSTTIVVITPTTTTTTTTTQITTTTTPNVLTCSSGFRSCPASLGGGCCPTGRACGRDVCPEISTSASLTAPIRPTTSSTTPQTTTTSRPPVSGCPTGFYACSAYYQGGCCQVGRDCASTSCPATASQTVVDTNGITAVAPSGTYLAGATDTPVGSCASGWSSCAATVGGGCCPTGYACGTAACSATASGGGGSLIGKEAPRSAASTLHSYPPSIMKWIVVAACVVLLLDP